MASEQEISPNEEKSEVSVSVDDVKNDKPVNGTKDANEEEQSEVETSEKQEPTPELLKKIKNQVEFYFGDVNMQRDKFLREQIKLDNGWIPMTVMLKFKLLASLSKDADVILKALESSDLIEISEDKKSIRRSLKYPLPVYDEEYRKAQEARTIYLKGFPQTETTIEILKEFFDQFEPYENIIMRKYQDKQKKYYFKGSIFVQFKTLEDAKAFMARESVKYKNEELIRKWSKDYAVEHQKEIEVIRETRKNNKAKKQQQEEAEIKDAKSNIEVPKGTLIHFKSTGTLSNSELKGKFHLHDIAHIEFLDEYHEGYIRFKEENAAKSAYETLKNGVFNLNTDHQEVVTCRIVTGEEEEKYLEKVREKKAVRDVFMKKMSTKKSNRKRQGTGHAATPVKVAKGAK